MCGKADRILKLISAGRAGLHRLDRYLSHNLPRGEGAWRDANFEREPKGGNQEHNTEGGKVFFHGHLPEF